MKVINAWDKSGKQMVTNGNGILNEFYASGNLKEVIKIVDGKNTGVWKTLYENGNRKEEGEFKNDVRHIMFTWSPEGDAELVDGNGEYSFYADDHITVLERGELKNGLREGFWTKFYETGTDTLQTATFTNGKMSGHYKLFFPGSVIQAEGEFFDEKRQGEWIWYFDSGMIESTVTFSDNKKIGDQTFFSQSGTAVKKEVYADDKLVAVELLLKESKE